MSLHDLLFNSAGRIPRHVWWLASLALIAVEFTVTVAMQPDYWSMSEGKLVPPNLPVTLFSLAMLIPNYIITVKRLNDRERPAWIAGLVVVILAAISIGDYFQIDQLDAADAIRFAELAALLAMLVVIVYECGLWRGTKGPNRHGPDPLDSQLVHNDP